MNDNYIKRYKDFTFIPQYRLYVPSGESETSINILSFVLDCVSFLFSLYVPAIKEKPLTVFIRCGEYDPQCFREGRAIFLKCQISSWAQAAFQFAHELCHYSIPGNVPENLRWLEESICQTASAFFLHYLTHFWKANNIQYRTNDGQLYADCFAEYAENDLQSAKPVNLKAQEAITDLEHNCYQRDKNRYIAGLFLPIFMSNPRLWSAVPALCGLRPNQSLQASLDEWLQIEPQEMRPGLLQLRALFF